MAPPTQLEGPPVRPDPHISEHQLLVEMSRAEQASWWGDLILGADSNKLQRAFVIAVGSRETELTEKRGDGGHGRGVLQIDDRWHPEIHGKPIDQTTARERILYGCELLAENVRQARAAFQDFDDYQVMKIAASGYNCGMRAAIHGSMSGDSDIHTTGEDYGWDVMRRYAMVAELRKEGH